jgi:hypothetical protein
MVLQLQFPTLYASLVTTSDDPIYNFSVLGALVSNVILIPIIEPSTGICHPTAYSSMMLGSRNAFINNSECCSYLPLAGA